MFIIDESNVKKSLDMGDAVGVVEDALIKYDRDEYTQPPGHFTRSKTKTTYC